jgi:hypothetical protein
MAQTPTELCNAALSKLGCRFKITASPPSASATSQEERICAARYENCKKVLLAMHPWNFAIKRTNLEPSYLAIQTCTNASGLIRVQTVANHGLNDGDRVTIRDVVGTTEANGTWFITKHDGDEFDLNDSTFSNAYVSGGEWTHAGGFDYTYAIALPTDCLRVLRVNDQLVSPDWRIEKGHILTNDDTNYVKYIYDAAIDDTMSILFYEALGLYLAWDISLELGRDNQTKEQLGRDFKEVLAKARFVDAMEDPAEQIEANDWVSSRFMYRGANSDPRYW